MWFIGAVFIGLVVRFTFLVIMPTNHQLLIPGVTLRRAKPGHCSKSG